jgi:hypothetical protein
VTLVTKMFIIEMGKHTMKFFWKLSVWICGMVYKPIIHQCFSVLWKQWNGPSWSYGSWIYNYQCNQCLSPLILWVQILIRARCTTLCDKVCQWLVTGQWFSPGPPISSTNNIDHHDITEILLKVALNTIKQTKNKQTWKQWFSVLW